MLITGIFYAIPKENPFWIILIFRTQAPMIFGNLYIYFISKYVAIKLGLANLETEYGIEELLDSTNFTDSGITSI